jgi:hypothetical protein
MLLVPQASHAQGLSLEHYGKLFACSSLFNLRAPRHHRSGFRPSSAVPFVPSCISG